jgi:hypothetical protein
VQGSGTVSEIPESVHRALERSGFPFQTAVADQIAHTPQWSVPAIEYPWTVDGDEHFIDVVAERGLHRYLIVECKKTQEQWVFLRPTGFGEQPENMTRVRCAYSERVLDSTMRMESACADWICSPDSIESALCVVSTTDDGKTRLLERDVRLLLIGAMEFALDRQDAIRRSPSPGAPPRDQAFYVPAIVTTAKLFSALYRPGDVNRATGQLERSTTEVRPEKWVRFRKSFTAGPLGLGDQTVFIVAAEALDEFLRRFEVADRDPHSTAGTHRILRRAQRASHLRALGYP